MNDWLTIRHWENQTDTCLPPPDGYGRQHHRREDHLARRWLELQAFGGDLRQSQDDLGAGGRAGV